MESNLYRKVVDVNKHIYSEYSSEYFERTKNGHVNYLKDFIDRFINSLSGKNVYDLGCGPGRDLEYFVSKGLIAKGVDCSSGMIDLCINRGLEVVENDFFGMKYEDNSVDGLWAYTSHTVIPKADFIKLIKKYKKALKENTGVLALGMIEGDFEGWKSDGKYNGKKRYVSRYSVEELEKILGQQFGTVSVERVCVGEKVYLHCICKNTSVARKEDTVIAAKSLFNKFSDQYLANTQTGIELLSSDREEFVKLLIEKNARPVVLDIGCGPGRDLAQLIKLGVNASGIDISEANVNNCIKQGANAIVGDIYKLSEYFSENQFDGVWCNCSVTNWIIEEELPRIFEMIKAIVKPGGYIFVGSVLGSLHGWEINEKYESMRRYNNHWDEGELRKYLSILGKIIFERKLCNTGKKDYLNVVIKNER